MNVNVSLRQLFLEDLKVIEGWYAQIKGATYTSRFGPKNFNGRDANEREAYSWYIIQVNVRDCGVIWLEKEEKTDDVAYLGIMIGKTDYFGKGIGKKAISLAISQSRQYLSFSKICLHVRKENTRAIRCYTTYGFYVSGEGEKSGSDGRKIEFLHMALDLNRVKY
ncbi:MAG: GCN5-related N-acetyltransferase [Firmicutes bacterium]|nr:GCN5-related N-acetyltransferase [Bacillota bacterium]